MQATPATAQIMAIAGLFLCVMQRQNSLVIRCDSGTQILSRGERNVGIITVKSEHISIIFIDLGKV